MYEPEDQKRKRARRVLTSTGYKVGGHFHPKSDAAADRRMVESGIHQHEDHEHGGRRTRLKLADGGWADGGEAPMRGDKGRRGKSAGKGGKTHVNILIAPQGDRGGGDGGLPTAPHPMMPPGGPPPGGGMPPGGPPGMPPGGMPPHPPMMPPMAPPTGNAPMGVGAPQGGMPPMRPQMPPGGMPPPMMRKAGGRAGRQRFADGGNPYANATPMDPSALMAAMQRPGGPGGAPAGTMPTSAGAFGQMPVSQQASPQQLQQMQAMMAQMRAAPLAPQAMPTGAPLPGGGGPPPPQMGGAVSPAQMPMGALPGGGGAAPQMGPPGRKAGGRAPKMHAGAGSGEGRLEKIGWD